LAGWSEIAAVVREEDADGAYILTLVENLQREDLTPKEEAAALEVLIRERKWSTRQVGEAIKRSPIYVSRRLRVFDDPMLSPLVLANELTVSTAEELLREPDADARRELAHQAVSERWARPQVRDALEKRNAALQQVSPRLASRLRALADELSDVEAASLSAREQREVRHLYQVLTRLRSTATV
jgi:ParB family chromosome partitioning protein